MMGEAFLEFFVAMVPMMEDSAAVENGQVGSPYTAWTDHRTYYPEEKQGAEGTYYTHFCVRARRKQERHMHLNLFSKKNRRIN